MGRRGDVAIDRRAGPSPEFLKVNSVHSDPQKLAMIQEQRRSAGGDRRMDSR